MIAPAAETVLAPPVRPSLRWKVAAAVLLVEYAILSVLVDFPTSGPALAIASAGRVLVPGALGAVSAGWLISRQGVHAALRDLAGPLPAWRPWRGLVPQAAAFAFTALLAVRVLGPGAPPATAGSLVAIGACAAACAVLALATAAPLRWLARFAWVHLGAQVAALAVGVLAWRAMTLAEGLWGVLSDSTLRAVAALLGSVRPDVIVARAADTIGLPGFVVRITPVCSGVDGLGLVLVFQSLWISVARDRLRLARASLLLPLGAVAALAANVVRISTLVLLGASGRRDLALGAFHSKLGWLLFLGIALATVLVAERVAWFQAPAGRVPSPEEGVPRRAAAYVGPLVAAIAASLVTSLWADGFDAWYAARVVAAAAVLLALRTDLPRLATSFSAGAVLLGAAVAVAWIAWPAGDGAGLSEAVGRLAPPAKAAWIAARVAGSCVVLPVVEELAFRGFLLPWLVAADFEAVPPRSWTWPAVVLSSIAFGAVHDQLVLGTLAGGAFAFARLRRGRLSDAVLAHGVANAAIAVAVLAFGRWDLWT